MHKLLTDCPVCAQTLHVTELQCAHCDTTITNTFELSKLATLSGEQLRFVEVFLTCRGNIKEVEKELGISYPTVRGKLNEVIHSLGYREEDKTQITKQQIVAMLENDEITPQQALEMLNKEED